MIAIIFESNQQTEFEALATTVQAHLEVVIPRYNASVYCSWGRATTNVDTEQRAFRLKKNIQSQIEGALTPEELASIVDVPLTNEAWFPPIPSE